MDFEKLIAIISQTNQTLQDSATKSVNRFLTIRNWLVGYYIFEYEQNGADRAKYGKKVLQNIAKRLNQNSFSYRNLKLFRQFYNAYPQIGQTVSAQLQGIENNKLIQQPASIINKRETLSIQPNKLLNLLSFSHFVELMKCSSEQQRTFYEIQTIKNNWSLNELKRAMNSMLYERTGLSTNKSEVLKKLNDEMPLLPADTIKNPYILEFLGLEEKSSYSENELEQAIINHLQNFLLEMGRGFCFEARQKRITFDNTHFYIDLVFYHRILKCHVLVDLKIGEFSYADAGQMNVYLNYYKENEMVEGDNPPVGLILCAYENKSLAKYALGGMDQEIFVARYMVELPSQEKLESFIKSELDKLED